MNAGSRPSISIGMAVRNSTQTLGRAIASLQLQTFTDWELILIDDGSTDDPGRIVRQLDDDRIRFFSDGRHRFLAARLNEAIQQARGDWFARMDADDIAYPQRLERQLAFLTEHPAVDVAGSGVLVFDAAGGASGYRVNPTDHAGICAQPHSRFPLEHPTFFGHTTWFRRHPYNERTTRAQDQDLLLRTYRHSTFGNVPEVLLGYSGYRVSLRKALPGRLRFALTHVQQHGRSDPVLAARAVGTHAFRAAVETVAVASGLGPRLQARRALPVPPQELAAWHDVWSRVTHACANGAS
jgi:glycosyltransferase involved in cell wall biosynthesis